MDIGHDATQRHGTEMAVDKPAHKRIDAVEVDVERIDRVIRGDGDRPGLAEQLRGVQTSIESLRLECIDEMRRVHKAVQATVTPTYVWIALVCTCLATAYAAIEFGRRAAGVP
jgi:hypothetical protein